MSKRLQVVIDENELKALTRAARRSGLTLSEWVRQALRRAERESDVKDPKAKLEALRRAMSLNLGDAVDIDQMLEEIERGYQQDL